MARLLPVPDAPIKQIRYATGNLLVSRYPIIASDVISISVWELQPEPFSSGNPYTVCTYDSQDFPEHFVCGKEHLRETGTDGRQYAWFGRVEGERAEAAIAEAFPGWKAEQIIPNAQAQARAENWAGCSPEYRGIATKYGACPACGAHRANGRQNRCETCREYDFPMIP